MPLKKKPRRVTHAKTSRKPKKSLPKVVPLIQNILIVALVLLVGGFIWSVVNNLDGRGNREFGSGTDLPSLIIRSEYEKETGHRIQVEVLNGCGISGLANRFAALLRHNGIDVLRTDNADRYDYTHTKAILRRGDQAMLDAVSSVLGLSAEQISTTLDSTQFVDVTVILGQDYNILSSYPETRQFREPF